MEVLVTITAKLNYVCYRGDKVAEASINGDTVPERGQYKYKHISLNVFVDNMTKFQNLGDDIYCKWGCKFDLFKHLIWENQDLN
ncbi:hypothetical protein L6164_032185 [Bauhinia variegata]|uniref:Uncharacterized protein n=1 Tax=Bauhinia variegata TaxID=167791 RepID=A0ACB9KN03_BAUVA|nr:hypothetical protein L6164_032185 [Bauhinia variegata]